MSAQELPDGEMTDMPTDLRDLVGRWMDAVQRKTRQIPTSLMGYGFALADGSSRYGEPCFVVVTQAGESMPLTHELLRALERNPLVLCGEVVCSLDSSEAAAKEHHPVRSLELVQAIGFGRLQPRDFACVTTRVSPEQLELTRWTFLTRERPEGWPR